MADIPGQLVALVDDEKDLRETVAYALRKEGYRVLTYGDGEQAWADFRRSLPDLIILDILMPRMDGLELCRRVRARSERVPLIFLTSRDEEIDRVLGLEMGADDYLCKPFSVRELLARVKVLFRRTMMAGPPEAGEEPLRCGHLELDPRRHTACWKQTPVHLTVTEFRILRALIRQPGHVRTREQLLQEGYPHDQYVSDRTVDSHIKRLRRKFQELDPAFGEIESIYGLGYRYAVGEP